MSEQNQSPIASTNKTKTNTLSRYWQRPKTPLHAHFDCFSGAAGDMMLAACIDAAGESEDLLLLDDITQRLQNGLPALQGEFKILYTRVWRGYGSIAGKHVQVQSIYNHQAAPVPKTAMKSHEHSHEHSHGHQHEHVHDHHHHHHHVIDNSIPQHDSNNDNKPQTNGGPLRNLPDIRNMLQDAPDDYIPMWVKQTAIQAFTHLANAEATVHGVDSIDKVHFHEVGAVDSIVDMVGTILALYLMNATTFSCSPLPLGQGRVYTEHGILPVPAPATLALMVDLPTTSGPPGGTGELVTPTGAALIKTLLQSGGGALPHQFTIRKIGIGAGTKDFDTHPNVLRLMLGE